MAVTDSSGVWVYAVAERAAADAAHRLPGVAGKPVRVLVAAGLAAVAEDVPLDEFGESALRRNLEDLSWLETAARAHHRVINAVAEQGPVVPMRLATVYRTDAGVAAALSDRAHDFREALRRTAARQEWGIKAYAVASSERDGRAAAGTSARPGGRPGTDAAAQTAAEAGAGAAYLRRRQGELTTQRNARRAAAASAEAIHAELCRLAPGSRLYPPQAPQLTGGRAQMILNAAYLIDDERGRDFAAAVTSLAKQHPDVRLELTGPWPPYSFAGTAEGDGRAGREGAP
jgi:Gas vesicle synthesis protein GvpL/GvpF